MRPTPESASRITTIALTMCEEGGGDGIPTPNCIPLRENRLSTLRTGGRFMTKRRTKSRRIRQSFADWSTSGTGKRCLFLRQQDYWIIRYRGATAFLKA